MNKYVSINFRMADQRHPLLEDRIVSCCSSDDDNKYTIEKAIAKTGYGAFHYKLLLVGGFINASDAIELLCLSILLPAAQCSLHINSSQKGWLNASVFIGMMIGGYLWGTLGDVYGRRGILVISLLINAVAGFFSVFAEEFYVFLSFRFVSGIGVGGSIPLIWAYISEFQPSNKRGFALSVIASFWMIGNILVAALALIIIPNNIGFNVGLYSFEPWRVFLALCAIPSFVMALILISYPESPMYLLLKGQHSKVLVCLRRVFMENTKKPLSDYPVSDLKPYELDVSDEIIAFKNYGASIIKTIKLTLALFKSSLFKITILMIVINFTIQFGYYGLWMWFPEIFNRLEQYHASHPNEKITVCELPAQMQNMSSTSLCLFDNPVSTDALVNTFIISCAPFPANLWTVFYMDKLGRKFFLSLSMVLSGLAAFGVLLMQSSFHNLLLAIVFGAVSTMGFNALDCLGAELFPTKLRSSALAVTLVSARIGAICGNIVFGYLLDIHCYVPLTIVAVFLISGGSLSIFLPNTTNIALR